MPILFALALLISFPAFSQPYPGKPVRLIVTYPPGGGADTMARLLSPKLGEALGQPVLVENRAGAGGTIGADLVAKSTPDGYTLMLDATNYAVNPSLYPKLPYDPAKAFAPGDAARAVSERGGGESRVSGVLHPAVDRKKSRPNPEKSPSPPPATVPRSISRRNSSGSVRVSTWCTCPTRAAARRSST